jgi:hypothetical protein
MFLLGACSLIWFLWLSLAFVRPSKTHRFWPHCPYPVIPGNTSGPLPQLVIGEGLLETFLAYRTCCSARPKLGRYQNVLFAAELMNREPRPIPSRLGSCSLVENMAGLMM